MYRLELESRGVLDTPQGEHVLMLATLLATGGHTTSGAATLSRELRAAREDALRFARKAADAVDELQQRRRALRGRTA